MNYNVREFPTSPENKEKQKSYSYEKYRKLGGIIDETYYNNALARLKDKDTPAIDKTRKIQAEGIARVAKIESDITEDVIKLYGILCDDVRSQRVKRHHDDRGDEHIFAEVLCMLGDTSALKMLIERYKEVNPEMHFKYLRNEESGNEEKYQKAA